MTTAATPSLRDPFPASQVGKLPKSGISLDYVGHGAVTSRLLDVDPSWNWEPLAFDDDGLPRFVYDSDGYPVRLWIKLTVLGVTRLGVGSVVSKCQDPEKQLIGDALRNAAMRFGVALDLWIKGHAEDDERHAGEGDRTFRRGRRPAPELSPVDEAPAVPAAWVDGVLAKAESVGIPQATIVRFVRAATKHRTDDIYEVRQGAEGDALKDMLKAEADRVAPPLLAAEPGDAA